MSSSTAKEPFELYVEKINPNDEFVIILEWLVESGSSVKQGQVIARLESSKAAYEYESPRDGYLQILTVEGEKVAFHRPIAALWAELRSISRTMQTSPPETAVQETKMTAKARYLMGKHGLTSVDFPGATRLRAESILAVVEKRAPSVSVRQRDEGHAMFRPSTSGQLEPLSPTKEFEISSLRRARSDFTFSNVTHELPESLINGALQGPRARGVHVTAGELFLWAAAQALKKYPFLNACRVIDGIHLYDEVHIGVAINLKRGLKTPVIRDVDKLSLEQVSAAVKDAALRYLRGNLSPQDFIGGTFTVTDLSSLGAQHFVPVVNEGQAAILGVCAPLRSSPYINLVLSFNHDVIDGMIAAQFLNEVERVLVGLL